MIEKISKHEKGKVRFGFNGYIGLKTTTLAKLCLHIQGRPEQEKLEQGSTKIVD